jgi:hypothetical protein
MTPEIISTLLQASPVTGLVLGFLYFMAKRDKETLAMVNKFTLIINGYLKDANKAHSNLAVKIHEFGETNKELKDALEKIYIHNKSIVDENKRLKHQSAGQG